MLAQITRHRIASFSVQSQRYVRLDDFRYVVPPEIEAIPEAKEAFLASMEEDAKRYLDLAPQAGRRPHRPPDGRRSARKAGPGQASKQANEDARFVLPNACETKMVVTMNARSLMNFFQLRCCNRAQWRSGNWLKRCSRWCTRWHPISLPSGPACLCAPARRARCAAARLRGARKICRH